MIIQWFVHKWPLLWIPINKHQFWRMYWHHGQRYCKKVLTRLDISLIVCGREIWSNKFEIVYEADDGRDRNAK